MSDAVAAARAAGTPDAVLELVQGDAFLRKCLQKAKFGADLLQDTLDACDINDLTALLLGSGTLSVTEASEKLFLMQDEASLAVATCRRECLRAGVHFGDGATLDPADAAEEQEGPAEQHAGAAGVLPAGMSPCAFIETPMQAAGKRGAQAGAGEWRAAPKAVRVPIPSRSCRGCCSRGDDCAVGGRRRRTC